MMPPTFHELKESCLAMLDQKEFNQLSDKLTAMEELANVAEEEAFCFYVSGRIALWQKEYTKAEEIFIKAIGFDDTVADYYNYLGYVYYVFKKYDQAVAALDQAIGLDKTVAKYYNNLGIVYSELKQYTRAATAYERAITLDDQQASYYNNLSNAYLGLKQEAQAVKACKQAIALDDQQASYYFILGHAYHELKEYDQAVKAYERAIALDNQQASYYNNLGNAYFDLKQYTQAATAYERAITLDGQDAWRYRKLAGAYANSKQYDQTVKACKQAIALDDQQASYYFILGHAYHELKEYDQAVKACKQAIALDDQQASYCFVLGHAYHELKEYDQAVKAYEKATALDNQQAMYYNNLGHAYHELKEYDQAVKAYERAIALDNQQAMYYNNLGSVYLKLKQDDQAVKACKQAITLDEKLISAHFNLAVAYYNLTLTHSGENHLALAEYHLQEAIRQDDLYPDPWELLALVSKKLSKSDFVQAQQWYRYEYLIRQKQKTINSLTELLTFFGDSQAYFFISRIIEQYPVLMELHSWHNLVQETLTQVMPLQRWLKAFIILHEEKKPALAAKVEGIMYLYGGDPSRAYQMLDEKETESAGEDLQYQYYLHLAGLKFGQDKEAAAIQEGALDIAKEWLAVATNPVDTDFQVSQLYYAGRFFWEKNMLERHSDYELIVLAIRCWERISHFPPALYMLMYSYHLTGRMVDYNDAVTRIIALEKQGMGLLGYMQPAALRLDEKTPAHLANPIMRYAYAQEVSQAVELLVNSFSRHENFIAGFKHVLVTRQVTDVWQIPPESYKLIQHYETQALQKALSQLREQVKNHSQQVYQWLHQGYPQKEWDAGMRVATIGQLITSTYSQELMKSGAQLNEPLLNYWYLEGQICYYEWFFLNIWDQVAYVKVRRMRLVQEEFIKAGLTSLISTLFLQGQQDLVIIAMTAASTSLASLFVQYLTQHSGPNQLKDIPNNYLGFQDMFIAYIRGLKTKLGEETFNERYPLAGFDEWVDSLPG